MRKVVFRGTNHFSLRGLVSAAETRSLINKDKKVFVPSLIYWCFQQLQEDVEVVYEGGRGPGIVAQTLVWQNYSFAVR